MKGTAAAKSAQSLPSVRTNEETNGETLRSERKAYPLFYVVCSALFGAIALLGLFLGFFMRGNVGALIAGGEPILHGSYLGTIVEVLRGSIAFPAVEGARLGQVLPAFLYAMILILAAAVPLSLALSVLTALRTRSARVLCTANGYLVLFVYGTLCVAGVLLGSIKAEIYSWQQLDLPSLTVSLLAFCLLAIMATVHKGARGVANALLLLFSALGVCAFIFPGTPLLSDLDLIGTDGLGFAKRIMLGSLAIALIADLVLSVLRLETKRGYMTEILRFGVQFIAALGLTAVYLAEEETFADFFMQQPLASVFLLLSPLAALLLSVFCRTFSSKRGQETPAKKSVEGETAPKEEEDLPQTLHSEVAIAGEPPCPDQNG